MSRPEVPPDERKVKVGIRLDPELYEWVQSQIAAARWASLTHAIEYALTNVRESEGSIGGKVRDLPPEAITALEKVLAEWAQKYGSPGGKGK